MRGHIRWTRVGGVVPTNLVPTNCTTSPSRHPTAPGSGEARSTNVSRETPFSNYRMVAGGASCESDAALIHRQVRDPCVTHRLASSQVYEPEPRAQRAQCHRPQATGHRPQATKYAETYTHYRQNRPTETAAIPRQPHLNPSRDATQLDRVPCRSLTMSAIPAAQE